MLGTLGSRRRAPSPWKRRGVERVQRQLPVMTRRRWRRAHSSAGDGQPKISVRSTLHPTPPPPAHRLAERQPPSIKVATWKAIVYRQSWTTGRCPPPRIRRWPCAAAGIIEKRGRVNDVAHFRCHVDGRNSPPTVDRRQQPGSHSRRWREEAGHRRHRLSLHWCWAATIDDSPRHRHHRCPAVSYLRRRPSMGRNPQVLTWRTEALPTPWTDEPTHHPPFLFGRMARAHAAHSGDACTRWRVPNKPDAQSPPRCHPAPAPPIRSYWLPPMRLVAMRRAPPPPQPLPR